MREQVHQRVQRELLLRSFFDVSPPPELAEMLAAQMKDRVFQPGDVLYEQGQPSGPIFFVHSGSIELSAPRQEPWLFEGQSFLGALDANASRPYARTATALTRVFSVEMHFDNYLLLLEDFQDFAQAQVRQSSQRTNETALRLAPDGVFAPPTPPKGRWHRKQERLNTVQRLFALKASEPFKEAPIQALVSLARDAVELSFGAGETVFAVGQTPAGIDLVVDGRVRLQREKPEVEGLAGPGQLSLGVLSIVPITHIYRGTATTDLTVLRIPHDLFFDTMEEHFALIPAWWGYLGRENARIRTELSRRGLTGDITIPPQTPQVRVPA